MITPLSSRPTIDHELLWRALRELVDRVFGALDSETVVSGCLDILVEILGADRGLVVLSYPDGSTKSVHARRNGTDLALVERDEISRTIVREAFQTGECVTYQAEMRAIKSVTTLGIVAALAIALGRHSTAARDPAAPRAVLYVDVRDHLKYMHPSHVEFFSSAALLIGTVLEQHHRGENDRAHLREAKALAGEFYRNAVARLDAGFDFVGRTEARRRYLGDPLPADEDQRRLHCAHTPCPHRRRPSRILGEGPCLGSLSSAKFRRRRTQREARRSSAPASAPSGAVSITSSPDPRAAFQQPARDRSDPTTGTPPEAAR